MSISIIDLAIRKEKECNDESEYLQDIMDENHKLKENLEDCLNILRMDDFSRDYIPERVSVQKMVSHVINALKKDFIYKGVFPKENIDPSIEVYKILNGVHTYLVKLFLIVLNIVIAIRIKQSIYS
ncbi:MULTISPECIES: hypothetical protein [Bacillus]|uniref:hypothetical protein n=1 Tax=Bacillus TaxID=1386 RepID=UPI0002D87426|nr:MULTISPECIES: hypothetical protein [Bacillus]